MLAEKNPQIKKAVAVVKELSADERTRMLVESREKARRDEQSRLEGAKREGIKEVAQNMLKSGIPVETIISVTNLSKEEIEALQAL